MAIPLLRILLLVIALTAAASSAIAEDTPAGDVLPSNAPAPVDTAPAEASPRSLGSLRPPSAARRTEGLAASPGQVLELRDPAPRVLTLDLTRDANDIWDRIRRGFGMPDLDTETVAEQQLFYLNRPGFLKRVFERGGRYLYHIVDELERRGMPTELALLPMVESSYNPMAYSRARASGLWQFIPSTGRNYNLTQDKWVDERRDVIASTNAALDYLQTIYEMHGDWHLALASYNWGEGAVGRAVQRNLAEGLPAEYSQLRMPEETRNYVPKLQALKNIVAQPELFHFELPYVPNTRHFVTVDTPAGIDLATAARLAEMPLEEFLALNPSYNRPATTRADSLVIPVDRAERFRARLAEHQNNGKQWRTYEMRRGDTLASVARDFGLSLSELHQINGLDARSRVSPGYTLLVPNGIEPDGAIAAARMIPRNAALDTSTIPSKADAKGAQAKGGKKSGAGKTSTGRRAAGKKASSGNAKAPAKSTAKTAPKSSGKTTTSAQKNQKR
ncbi:transglycosylase SLT domain-containing protein [Aromatoleum petrolei]|uniref:transglycosylase SLT domain-containing protein n=1 Tax=Aromatoleum petrolei TaxID=76116 RepID=UPI001AEC5542|nr:transglycosylase SLT domain-containing protein [Aromatoleum petrolei]QTQ34246.1 Putative transglycosylase, lysozym-like [Aromatoleum petrolei]